MFLFMSLCSGIAAFGLFAGVVWAYFKQKSQMESRVPATGTVVELVHRNTTDGYTGIFCPVVEFSTPSGERIRFTSDFGSRPASHKIGQSVRVRYDAADPQKAEIESGLTTWLTPLILAFMGVIACCLTVAFLAAYGFGSSSFSP
jgi:nitrate reductase NapE component